MSSSPSTTVSLPDPGKCFQGPQLVLDGQQQLSLNPILRWAGGKRQIIKMLADLVPSDLSKRPYYEPFFGAGSLFFWVGPKNAHLSDANEHLIEMYRSVRDEWGLVARYLSQHARRTCKKYYYGVRTKYNSSQFSAAQAARFIYLNKTCFNGIFRVNRQGRFNVPYGWKEPPALPSRHQLMAASLRLRSASLKATAFKDMCSEISKGDFVYLDPPYPALNGTSYFTHYTTDRFSSSDQEELAEQVSSLDAKGGLFLMTNADTPSVRKLYRNFQHIPIPVVRFITCKSKRHTVSELVIRNFRR